MSDDRYCEGCYNTGELDCHCGGDLCICERNGTYSCPVCGGREGFTCDEIYDEIEQAPLPLTE